MSGANDPIAHFYPLVAYVGVLWFGHLIDNKATIKIKGAYIRKGLYEMMMIVGILVLSHHIAVLIKPVIALPQIFFAMIISATLWHDFFIMDNGPNRPFICCLPAFRSFSPPTL